MRDRVIDSAELRRVLDLPRRDWSGYASELARELTPLLRRPGSGEPPASLPAALKPIQAVALQEASDQSGLLAPIGVGQGKTLISFMLSYVWDAKRPLLIIPANLEEKTSRDLVAYGRYWKVPNWITVVSAESVGLLQNKDALERLNPDAIVIDEAHMFKALRTASRAKVLNRFIESRREAEERDGVPLGTYLKFAAMSGTLMSRTWRDFAHVAEWSLGAGSPVPRDWNTLDLMCNALDDGVNPLKRVAPGALEKFYGPDEDDARSELERARRAMGRRLVQTPGVVASKDTELGTGLQIRSLPATPSLAIDAAFETLRDAWELPDGYIHTDGNQVWAQARQIALGFYYVWDPRPPREWLEPRRAWGAFVREHTVHGDLDSELHVATTYPDAPELAAWRAVKDSFTPNVVPVWICDSVVNQVAAWVERHRHGVVWVEHVAFGQRLSEITGVGYFQNEGLDASGCYIEDAKGPVIASIDANQAGRNMQFGWHQNLYTSPEKSYLVWEQSLARTHRPGQVEDTVSVDVIVNCFEHIDAFEGACSRARAVADTERQAKKLCYADITVGVERNGTSPARWNKAWRRKAA